MISVMLMSATVNRTAALTERTAFTRDNEPYNEPFDCPGWGRFEFVRHRRSIG
ncbi:MAG: hypothetical protein HLUCCO18_12885 [Rhodobacteraceae bacterium HLUCCO18]|nr:MAG: hypothetical protein HLUCCO18_12885 [Rhodobacteraceae bacterium HLUCCO18]